MAVRQVIRTGLVQGVDESGEVRLAWRYGQEARGQTREPDGGNPCVRFRERRSG